jgi:uncharacterized protein (DUF2249 family)
MNMISRDTKVGKMLKEHPQTLEVLLAASPHFSKLKNPLLRNTLAPRVSIEQAAKIAGVHLSELLQTLNHTIGATMKIDESGSVSSHPGPAEPRPNILDELHAVELDVRPILQGGVDPLKTILKAVEQLGPNEYLRLVNSFEPIPLYAVLGKRGFDHFTEHRDGIFQVHFFRRMAAANKLEHEDAKGREPQGSQLQTPAREKTIEIDVRELAPPEPMMKILEALPQVDERTLLFVHHHREPLFLYAKLQARGYKWNLDKISETYYHLRIWREDPVVSNAEEPRHRPDEPPILDVRQVAPAVRHPIILQAFAALAPGTSLILINDHDPKPLYYQFKFEQADRFTWEYLEQGPEVWRVNIGKAGASVR